MPILLTAPVGAGKTAAVIDDIVKQKAENPWRNIWVLLPTELQINAFRDRLMKKYQAANQHDVLFGIEYFSFYELYRHLLDRMLLSQWSINRGAVYRIVRHLIADLSQRRELHYFQSIADKSGFIKLVAEFIFELKQARLSPSSFQEYAQLNATPKALDLANIYTAYQDWVSAEKVVDREGAGWLALEKLGENGAWLEQVGLLVVDGFQQFSPLQLQLLQALAQRVQETVLTLSYPENNQQPVYQIFERTWERLHRLAIQWEPYTLDAPTPSPKNPTLEHLTHHFMTGQAQKVDANEAVCLIEAANAEQEVRGALRQVKKRLLEGAIADEMVIVVHDMGRYGDLLRSIAPSYGISLAFRQGLKLVQNPAVASLLTLLDLHSSRVNFSRQATLDVLRSPYFTLPTLSADDVELLEKISLQFKVVGSREDWLEAIHDAQSLPTLPNSDEEIPEINAPRHLAERVEAFFNFITPPAMNTVQDFITWLEALLGPDPHHERDDERAELPTHLCFYENIRNLEEASDPTTDEFARGIITRDLYAMHAVRTCYADIFNSYDLLGQANHLITWASFREDLQFSIEQAATESLTGGYRHGKILVTTSAEARGLPHQHVIILGLAEGAFPSLRRENPLYSDLERQHFNAYIASKVDENPDYRFVELNLSTEGQNDSTIFFEALAAAQKSLILTRPTLDDKANPWPPSVLWEGVLAQLENTPVIHYRAGEAPRLHEAPNLSELSVGLVEAMQNPKSTEDTRFLDTLYAWLMQHEPYRQRWEAILHGQAIELQRLNPKQAYNQYTGILQDPALISIVAQKLGSQRLWSATQFNDYGYCPFRFFSKRLLHLEALQEPEAGFDVLQLGTLQHAILEETYMQIRDEQLVIRADLVDRALGILADTAERIFRDAPERFGFRAPELWEKEQAEILQRLQRLIRLDFSDNPDSPFIKKSNVRKPQPVADIANGGERYVYDMELGFGEANQAAVVIAGSAGDLKTRGSIDRIDIIGDTLVIMDYKSGSKTPTNQDMEAGRNFQMMLYILAAQQLAEKEGLTVGAGMFWSLRSLKSQGEILANDPLIEEARQQLHAYIEAGREGIFAVEPRKKEKGKCFTHCEFNQFCRVQNVKVFDTIGLASADDDE